MRLVRIPTRQGRDVWVNSDHVARVHERREGFGAAITVVTMADGATFEVSDLEADIVDVVAAITGGQPL